MERKRKWTQNQLQVLDIYKTFEWTWTEELHDLGHVIRLLSHVILSKL